MASILVWLARLGPWLRGLLPAAAGMFLKAWTAWQAIKLGKRLIVIGAIGAFFPLPDWVEDIPARIAAMPEPFWFFADLIQAQFGFYVVMSAFTFRWVWRILTKG